MTPEEELPGNMKTLGYPTAETSEKSDMWLGHSFKLIITENITCPFGPSKMNDG